MKIRLLALCALLSVATAFAQQKYMLPIGSNVNNRSAKVGMTVGPVDAWEKNVWDVFSYEPSMGVLETVIKSRFRALIDKLPVVGFETGVYGVDIRVDPGPFQPQTTFTFQQSGNRWIVPPEVLEVKLQYGLGTGWRFQGITDVKMRLFKNGEMIKYYSTKEGVGPDSPCEIGATQEVLAYGYASVRGQYSFPWLKENWWDTGEVTIEAYDGWATFFNANGSPRDGELIAVSEPPPVFLASLRAPDTSQAPVLVANTPRIAKITRILGNATEIVVEGEAGGTVAVEFSEKLSGEWTIVNAPLVLTSTGRRVFTHTTDAPVSFYRLRLADSSPQ